MKPHFLEISSTPGSSFEISGTRIILFNKELHEDFIETTNLKNFDGFPNQDFIGIFSSGSTGDFKLILHSPKSFIESAKVSSELIIDSHKRAFGNIPNKLYSSLPLFHTGGLLSHYRKTFFEKIHLVPKIPFQEIDNQSVVVGVPAHIPYLLKQTKNPFTFYCGGDSPNEEMKSACLEKGVNLISTYGLTESCGAILYQNNKETKVFKDVEIKINNDSLLTFKTKRQAFEVLKFVHNKWETIDPSENGYIFTKDLAKYNEKGEIEIIGRSDSLIISGGENIHPKTIEEKISKVLIKNSVSFKQLKVLGMPDSRLGKVVTLFIDFADTKEIVKKEEEVIKLLARNLTGLDRPRYYCPFPPFLGIKPKKEDFQKIFKDKKREIK